VILRIVAVSALLAAGQILLKLAMPPDSRGLSLFTLLLTLMGDWRFWAACLCTATGAVFWTLTVAGAPVGVAYPIMVSLSLVFVVAADSLVFHRPFDIAWVAGVAFIIGGIWLVTRGNM